MATTTSSYDIDNPPPLLASIATTFHFPQSIKYHVPKRLAIIHYSRIPVWYVIVFSVCQPPWPKVGMLPVTWIFWNSHGHLHVRVVPKPMLTLHIGFSLMLVAKYLASISWKSAQTYNIQQHTTSRPAQDVRPQYQEQCWWWRRQGEEEYVSNTCRRKVCMVRHSVDCPVWSTHTCIIDDVAWPRSTGTARTSSVISWRRVSSFQLKSKMYNDYWICMVYIWHLMLE